MLLRQRKVHRGERKIDKGGAVLRSYAKEQDPTCFARMRRTRSSRGRERVRSSQVEVVIERTGNNEHTPRARVIPDITSRETRRSLNNRAKPLDARRKDPKALISAVIWIRPEYELANAFSEYKMLDTNFMDKQIDLTSRMRHILIDWVVDVCEEYRLGPRVLYLSVDIIDRMLSGTVQVVRGKLQLLGIAAMLTASDAVFSDIDANSSGHMPTHEDMRYISDDTYSIEDIAAEHEHVSQVIQRESAAIFARHRYSPRNASSREMRPSSDVGKRITLFTALKKLALDVPEVLSTISVVLHTQRFAELAIMRVKMLKYHPRLLAVACVVKARHELGITIWDEIIEDGTGFRWSQVQPCFSRLIREIRRATVSDLRAVRMKYEGALERFCTFRHAHLVYAAPPTAPPYAAIIDYDESDGRHCVLYDHLGGSSSWIDLRERPFVCISSAASAVQQPKAGDKVLCADPDFGDGLPRNAIVKSVHRASNCDTGRESKNDSDDFENASDDACTRTFIPGHVRVGSNGQRRCSVVGAPSEPVVDVEYASDYVTGFVETDVELERIRFYEWKDADERPPLVAQSTRVMLTWLQYSNAIDAKRELLLGSDAWQQRQSDDAAVVPDELCCPITNKLMVDPVIASDGFTYERIAIIRWMSNNDRSPMTRTYFNDTSLRRNRIVAAQIRRPNLLDMCLADCESTDQSRRASRKKTLLTDRTCVHSPRRMPRLGKRKRAKRLPSPAKKRLKPSTARAIADVSTFLPRNEPSEVTEKRAQILQKTFENDEDNVPIRFCCPLTRRLFVEPVVVNSGDTFERWAVQAHVSRNKDKSAKNQRGRSTVIGPCSPDPANWWHNNTLKSQISSFDVVSWKRRRSSSNETKRRKSGRASSKSLVTAPRRGRSRRTSGRFTRRSRGGIGAK